MVTMPFDVFMCTAVKELETFPDDNPELWGQALTCFASNPKSEDLCNWIVTNRVYLCTASVDDDSILHHLAHNNNLNLCERILKAPNAKELVCAPNPGGVTPLHVAAAWANLDIINHLIRHGAIVDAADARKETPLIYALTNMNDSTPKVVKMLWMQAQMCVSKPLMAVQLCIWRLAMRLCLKCFFYHLQLLMFEMIMVPRLSCGLWSGATMMASNSLFRLGRIPRSKIMKAELLFQLPKMTMIIIACGSLACPWMWTAANPPQNHPRLDEPPYLPSLRVGFVGERGGGKSTLINSLLEYPILPVAAGKTSTAAVAEVTGWSRPDIQVTVVFDDFKHQFKEIIAKHNQIDHDDQEDLVLADLQDQLRALNNDDSRTFDFGEKSLQLEDVIPDSVVKKLLSRYETTCFPCGQESQAFEHIASALSADGCFWPIVSRVFICGPFKLLVGNKLTLVDIPGREELGPLVQTRYSKALEYCHEFFYVPTIDHVLDRRYIAEFDSAVKTKFHGLAMMKIRENWADCFGRKLKLKTIDEETIKKAKMMYLEAMNGIITRENFQVFLLERSYQRDDYDPAVLPFDKHRMKEFQAAIEAELINWQNDAIANYVDNANRAIAFLGQLHSPLFKPLDITLAVNQICDTAKRYNFKSTVAEFSLDSTLTPEFRDVRYSTLRALFKYSSADRCAFKQLQLPVTILRHINLPELYRALSLLHDIAPAINEVLKHQGILSEHLGTSALANWIKSEIEQSWVKLYNSLQQTVCSNLGPPLHDAYHKVAFGANCEQNMKAMICELVRNQAVGLNEQLRSEAIGFLTQFADKCQKHIESWTEMTSAKSAQQKTLDKLHVADYSLKIDTIHAMERDNEARLSQF
jgi:GTPase SAR1 family protein